jgi:hypothetical protein
MSETGPFNQAVKVETATEPEGAGETTSMKISWFTAIVATMSVDRFPEIEAPLIADICVEFLASIAANAPKMVKGGLLEEHGIDVRDVADFLAFLRENRITVDGLVLRSPA